MSEVGKTNQAGVPDLVESGLSNYAERRQSERGKCGLWRQYGFMGSVMT